MTIAHDACHPAGAEHLPDAGGAPEEWRPVKRVDVRARALADRHYSRQTPGHREFMPPGRTLVMVTADASAVWGAVENWFKGERRWRVSIFRNEGEARSSDLIRTATVETFAHWVLRYGALPEVPLRTEVDPAKTRHKRDPGRCFIRAGWRRVGVVRGLVVLEAPSDPLSVKEDRDGK